MAFRKEIKFVIHQSTFENLRSELDYLLTIDFNTDIFGYIVKSLYFDTFHNKDLYDVLDGSFLKSKIRLRTYGSSGVYKLELKQKRGNDVIKRSVLLDKDQAQQIAKGDYDVLLSGDAFAKELYCKMKSEVYRPKLVVSYNRQAYIHPVNNTRITFDTKVKTNVDTKSFFLDFDYGLNSMEPMMGILEVKYEDFLLDPIKMSLSKINASQSANSKYVNAQLKFSF